jgi:formylmethanofuran dehydrogenase subunit E
MPEGQSRWKQKFFDDVEPIFLRDPLSVVLGAMDEEDVMVFKYPDAVKLAGHSCVSVSGAYKLTAKALKSLYGEDVPIRGDITVTIMGGPEDMAYGPISQVISFITGAAPSTGFKGLKGKFKRQNNLIFDKANPEFNTFIFQRSDTGKTVKITFNPQVLPQNQKMGELMSQVLSNKATEKEREEFIGLWQGNVKEVLLNDDKYKELFNIEEIEGYNFS